MIYSLKDGYLIQIYTFEDEDTVYGYRSFGVELNVAIANAGRCFQRDHTDKNIKSINPVKVKKGEELIDNG
jgi:hypothetical protein